MSGAIFGIVSLDDRGVNPDHLIAMDHAMAYWGPDGGGMHTQNHLAFGAHLLITTPTAEFEQQPLSNGPHRLVARARLDNRRDLCRRLGITNNPETPDSELILLAYRKYSSNCVEHLIGDWSFALWDADKDLFILARDASGNTGLHYWLNDKQLVFSSGIQGILAVPGFVKRINQLHLACRLTALPDTDAESSTIYADIKLLPPGHMMISQKSQLQLKRWWQPEMLSEFSYKRPEDCYEHFVALYEEVVHEHLRISHGNIAATLSGGLDSGSIVSLAAPILRGTHQHLDAFVHVPLYEPKHLAKNRVGNELPLAQATARHVGNINIKPISSPTKTLLWGMWRGLEIHGMPTHAASHNYWLYDVQEQAQAIGSRVLLTGQMGNSTVSFAGNGNLWPELLRGRLVSLLTNLLHDHGGIASAVKYRLLKPLLLPALKYRNRLARHKTSAWLCNSFINPEFANSLQIKDRMLAHGFDNNPALINSFRLGLAGNQLSGLAWMESGAAYALDIRDATRDRRIVEFCWRTPDIAFWANGLKRGLIRRGMQTHLPAEVLYSSSKGLQSADILERLRTEAGELLSLIEPYSNSIVSEYLDLKQMIQTLRAIDRDEPVNPHMLHSLTRSLQCALFLGQSKGL